MNTVEAKAIKFASDYFAAKKYDVEDVSKKRGYNGYDLLISEGEVKLKVEVKGCTREWQIPDLYSTEFDLEKKLVADYLCVVYFLSNQDPLMCLIPRIEIDSKNVIERKGYRLRSTMKKESFLKKFIIE